MPDHHSRYEPMPIADPDDPGFGDQDRYVGDGTGMPRVAVGPPVVAAVAVLAVMIMVGATLGVVLTWLVTGADLLTTIGLGLALGAVALLIAFAAATLGQRR